MISLEKTNEELIEYFDHINQSLNTDFDYVFKNTRILIEHPDIDKKIKAELEWSLTHLHTDLVKLHQQIKEYQRVLKDASKPIQNTIR